MKYFGRIVAILLALLPLVAFSAVDVPENEYVVFYAQDMLGSPVAISDDQGRVLWYENSQPYGKSLGRKNFSGDGFRDNASEEAVSRVGYTGHQANSTTGLVYMKARYYDPHVGRFYSNDPVGFNTRNTASFNRYLYSSLNPYKYVDPDGREVILALSKNSQTSEAYNNLKFMDISASVVADLEASPKKYYISNKTPVAAIIARKMSDPGWASKDAFIVEKGEKGKPTIYIKEGIGAEINVAGKDGTIETQRITHESVLLHELGHLHLYDKSKGVRGFQGRNKQTESEIWRDYDDGYNMSTRTQGGETIDPNSGGFWAGVKSMFGFNGEDSE